VRERLANAYPVAIILRLLREKTVCVFELKISQPFVPQAVNLEKA
jgi:hypothetical protein